MTNMKKSTKKVTLGTLDKKIDTLVTTVDNLAIATERGFSRTASKEELTDFRKDTMAFAQKTSLTLFNIDSKLQTVDQRLDAIEKTLGPLVQVSSFMQKEIRELNARVTKLEHNASIK